MYIAGPGSHVKGIDLAISNKVKIRTKKLSNIIESHLVNASTSKHFKRSLFQKNNLLRKRDNSEARLTKLKEKISSLEQEIESIFIFVLLILHVNSYPWLQRIH